MGRAYVTITGELLLGALCFPEGTKILAAGDADIPDDHIGDVKLLIEHEDLKEIANGTEPPHITPMFERRSPMVMSDWGQQ